MNILKYFGLCRLTAVNNLHKSIQALADISNNLRTELDEVKENDKMLFAHNQSLTSRNQKLEKENAELTAALTALQGRFDKEHEQSVLLGKTVIELNDKLEKKGYWRMVSKMGNMSQQINRLKAELNRYRVKSHSDLEKSEK